MKGLRTIVVIALAATGLLHFQASVSHACADDRANTANSPTSAGDDHGQGTHAGHAPDAPTGTDGSSCPMSGLMLPCGTATAAPVTLVLIVPASAVSSAGPLARTFLIPPSFSGSDLFHPPRA